MSKTEEMSELDRVVIMQSQRDALYAVVDAISRANYKSWPTQKTPEEFVAWAKSEASRVVAEVDRLSSLPPSGPTPAEEMFFFQTGDDGFWSTVAPFSELKSLVHKSMCMCGRSWDKCESPGVTETCLLIDDKSEWEFKDGGTYRWAWGQDFEDGHIHITRVMAVPPSGAASEVTFQAWLDKQVEPNDEDYPSPEAIGFAEAAWNAGKASAKEK